MTDPPDQCGTPRYTTRVLRSAAEIAAVAEECAGCRRFQRRPQADLGPDLAPPADDRTRVVLLYEDGEIVGFASLAIAVRTYPWRTRLPGRGAVLASFRLRSAEYCDNDLIAPDDIEARGILLRAMLAACADCCVLRLRFVGEDSDLWRMLAASPAARDGCWVQFSRWPCPRWLVRTVGSYADYFAMFRSSSRSALRRHLRDLARACDGDLRLVVATSRADLACYLSDALKIARGSIRAAAAMQTLTDGRLVDRLERLADAGQLRCHLLMAGDEPIAYTTGWVVAGVHYSHGTAYDMRWSKHSPGTLLSCMVIEDAFQSEQVRWINYGYGHLDYKQFLATDGYNELCADLIRPSVRTALVFGPISLVARARAALGPLIRRARRRDSGEMRHGSHDAINAALTDKRSDRCRDMRC